MEKGSLKCIQVNLHNKKAIATEILNSRAMIKQKLYEQPVKTDGFTKGYLLIDGMRQTK